MDALDYFAIQNLIHRYADLLDRGKVDEVGALFDHADVYMPDDPSHGPALGRIGWPRSSVSGRSFIPKRMEGPAHGTSPPI